MVSKKKPTIAICYDFDGTLIRGNMQENSFLEGINISPGDFWKDVKKHGKTHDMDEVLAYMQKMLDKSREKDRPFSREALAAHGKSVKFFPGVTNWFSEINNYAKGKASIEHYVISSGLDEMIKGSAIGHEFKHIFASGFVYDANDVAVFPARSINYTTKVQYLFRINKGIINSWDNKEINKFTPEKDRAIPFSQMIYIGDGDTDVPAMKMVNYKGGYSIVVYPPKASSRISNTEKERKENAERMQENNRCQFIAEADYEKDKLLFEITTMLIDRIVSENHFEMNLKAAE